MPSWEDCRDGQLDARSEWGPVLDRMREAGWLTIGAGGQVEWCAAAQIIEPYLGRMIARHRRSVNAKQASLARKLRLWKGEHKGFGKPAPVKISRIENGSACAPLDLIEFSCMLGPTPSGKTLLSTWEQMVRSIIGSKHPDAEDVQVLAAAVAAVRKAGTAIHKRVQKKGGETRKKDVRAWGDEVENAVQKGIQDDVMKRLHVGNVQPLWIGQLAETEEDEAPLKNVPDGRLVMVIDAVEGFRMFLRDLPMWCITVGAGRKHKEGLAPICGVVMSPPAQELFVGLVDGGAVVLNEHSRTVRRLRPSRDFRLHRTVIGTHLSTSRVSATEKFVHRLLDKLPVMTERVLMLGSGQLALCYVAAGRLDAYLNVATNYWNVFAGKVILDTAACCSGIPAVVRDFRDEPFTLGRWGVLACGNQYLYEFMRALVRLGGGGAICD